MSILIERNQGNSVPFRPTAGQMSNLALIETKQITVYKEKVGTYMQYHECKSVVMFSRTVYQVYWSDRPLFEISSDVHLIY